MGLLGLMTKSEVNSLVTQAAESVRLNTEKDLRAQRIERPLFLPTSVQKQWFDGEKTPFEMGKPKEYYLLYPYLRARSWQSYLESEVTQAIINKYVLWMIGTGLKLQPEPETDTLISEGINIDTRKFQAVVESRFKIWSHSLEGSYDNNVTFNDLEWQVCLNALIGGDVLVINRVIKGQVKQQIIDGGQVISPFLSDQWGTEAKKRGNRIEDGIELDPAGRHVAYYVNNGDGSFVRVPRYGARSGRLMAYLVYGSRYRINTNRGMPILTAILEKLKKLDRYQEATLTSAEQGSKIVYAIEHGTASSGENPLAAKLKNAGNMGTAEDPTTKSLENQIEETSTKIASMTGGQAFNMPIDTALKPFESKKELYFNDFYTVNTAAICAAVGVPYEVAWSMYNSNFSASRAAIQDWAHTLKVKRAILSRQHHSPYYWLWLDNEILKGKIQADGYLRAVMDKNVMAVNAYRDARWTGARVANVDPVKEIEAIRRKLGDKTTPLIDYDQASEEAGGYDFRQVQEKIGKQRQFIETQNTEE